MGRGGIRPNRKEHTQGEMRLAHQSPESKGWKAGEVTRDQARQRLDSEQAFCILIVETSTHFNHLDQLFTVCIPRSSLCHFRPLPAPRKVGLHRLCHLTRLPPPGYRGGERREGGAFISLHCLPVKLRQWL